MRNDVFLVNMGTRIAQRRKELHMTQEQLADKMGVSLQTVSCIELGKKGVRPENLANMCAFLDVTSDYILYGKRDSSQMSDITQKLSALDKDAYRIVQELTDLLYKRRSSAS